MCWIGISGRFCSRNPYNTLDIVSGMVFFSRSSKHLEQWLINHKTFGPLITDWKKYKGIKRKSKIISICLIIPTFSFTIYSISNFYLQLSLGLFCICLCTYLITRPEPPVSGS